MKMPGENREKSTWFNQRFLNNQMVTSLLVVLLCLLIILIFTKVSHLFAPIAQFMGIVGLPIVISGLLFYIFNPIVNFFEKKGMTRNLAITLLFIIIFGLIAWGIVILIPKIEMQTKSLINEWPSYWAAIEEKVTEFFNIPLFDKIQEPLEKSVTEFFNSISTIAKSISTNAFKGIGNVVGAVASIVVSVVMVPFFLFYLLKDGHKLAPNILKVLPTKARKPTMNVLTDINKQLSSYVRGQVTVAVTVAIMFMTGFSIVGLNYSVTLGVLAGFLNLIPYIGSAMATIPAILLAMAAGPKMLIAVILVFVIEQLIEGKFVSPLVLGSQMKIHPLTIIIVLLTAGKLFGVLGVILGIPGYAVIKVIFTHLFSWYKEVSGLYTSDIKTTNLIEKEKTSE